MKCDLELAQRIVDFMNELVTFDKVAIAMLIENRMPCNKELGEHPTVQTMILDGKYYVGLLGILNGICGVDESGYGLISVEFAGKNETETSPKTLEIMKFLLTSKI